MNNNLQQFKKKSVLRVTPRELSREREIDNVFSICKSCPITAKDLKIGLVARKLL